MDSDSPLSEAVRQHYLFAGLEPRVFDELVATMGLRHIAKGGVLFHRGDNADHFYFLNSGLIELSLIAASGEKKTLEVVGPGRTFGEAIAFMREHKFPVTAESLADSELCQIPNKAYIDLLQSNPGACMRLLADISRHLHARVREIEHLTIQNARSRLISYLMDHVAETTENNEAVVRLNLPRHVIASRLSITPETLSRLLRNLTDEGLISTEDRIVFIHRLSDLRLYD
jgi:CRP-like cAMP-binding protein